MIVGQSKFETKTKFDQKKCFNIFGKIKIFKLQQDLNP